MEGDGVVAFGVAASLARALARSSFEFVRVLLELDGAVGVTRFG